MTAGQGGVFCERFSVSADIPHPAGEAYVPPVSAGTRKQRRLKGQVPAVRAPAQGLDRYPQVLFKMDGVGNMPPVHGEPLLAFIAAPGADHLGQARIGRRKLLVFMGFPVHKVVRTAEIILCPGPADGGVLRVPVQVEFDLPFSPPEVGVGPPEQGGAHIVAFSCDAVGNGVNLFIRLRIDPAELGVEIGRVFRRFHNGIIDLVINVGGIVVPVFNGDQSPAPEGHGPVAVETAAGIDADRQGRNLAEFSPAAPEKVPNWAFYRGDGAVVPVYPQDQAAPVPGGGEPHLPDTSGFPDIR